MIRLDLPKRVAGPRGGSELLRPLGPSRAQIVQIRREKIRWAKPFFRRGKAAAETEFCAHRGGRFDLFGLPKVS